MSQPEPRQWSPPAERTIEERNALVVENLKLAYYLAPRAPLLGYRTHYDREDLTSVALLALVRAATLWDPARGDFGRFASVSIRQYLCKWVISQFSGIIRVPANVSRTTPNATQRNTRLAEARDRVRTMPLRSDNRKALLASGDWYMGHQYDLEPADDVPEPWEILEGKEDAEGLHRLVESMPGLPGEVLRRKLADPDRTCTDIAEELGVTRQGAYEGYRRGLNKLRKLLGESAA